MKRIFLSNWICIKAKKKESSPFDGIVLSVPMSAVPSVTTPMKNGGEQSTVKKTINQGGYLS